MGQNPNGSFVQNPDKSLSIMQIDALGALSMGQRYGKYFAGSMGKGAFMAASQAAAVTSVALATTYTGFCLSNPAASGKLLVLQKVGVSLPVAAAGGQSIGLITGWAAGGITVHTTPITAIRNGLVGDAAASIAKVDAACTLVGAGANAPGWAKWLTGAPAVAGVVTENFDIDGEIIIPAGGYVAIGTLIASGAAGFLGSMSWQEIDDPAA